MPTDTTLTIALADGHILALHKDDVVRARGIKFATAQRFQKPLPSSPWTGLQDCTNPAPICPQLPSRYDPITGCLTDGNKFDEDCLNLTVTCPLSAVSTGAKLPVMVFFHGGAYVAGGGDLEVGNTSELSKYGAVLVSVTYRLGCFGYLYVDGVAPANLGLMDQIAALQWVKKNIKSFGGDSENITIFGQSAGADSVFCLLGADGTEYLFHRAILQSAPLGRAFQREELLQNMGKEAEKCMSKEQIQVSGAEDMLEMQAKVTLEAQKMSEGSSMAFAPCCGHFPLPSESEFRNRIATRTTKIPILIGWTSEEAKPYIHLIPSVLAYTRLPIIGKLVEKSFVYFFTGKMFKWPSQALAGQVNKSGGSAVTYCFNWAPSDSLFGAAHAIDLPFLFGDWNSWKAAPFLKGDSSEKVVETLGAQVKGLWVAFAKGETAGYKHIDIEEDFRWL